MTKQTAIAMTIAAIGTILASAHSAASCPEAPVACFMGSAILYGIGLFTFIAMPVALTYEK